MKPMQDLAIRTASAITRNREMAKDAVQETFIRVYRQIIVTIRIFHSTHGFIEF